MLKSFLTLIAVAHFLGSTPPAVLSLDEPGQAPLLSFVSMRRAAVASTDSSHPTASYSPILGEGEAEAIECAGSAQVAAMSRSNVPIAALRLLAMVSAAVCEKEKD